MKMDCSKACREEFRAKNFLLFHSKPRLFVKSQCLPDGLYLIWVTLWAVHHFVIMGLQPYFDYERDPDKFPPDPKWPVYLTNWGITVLALFSIYDCIVTWYVQRRNKDLVTEDGDLPWYLKVQWVLFNVGTVSSISITIMYFFLLTPVFTSGSILTHITTSVFSVSNLIICAKPMRVFHFFHGFLFAAVYSLFTLIYQKASDDLIYSLLDWDVLPNTIYFILGLAFVLVPVVHLVCFTIYSIRVCTAAKCCHSEELSLGDQKV